MLNQHKLFFHRSTFGETDVASIVECKTEDNSASKTLNRIKKAVTKWVATTDEGKRQWIYSSEDMNIGDLSSFVDDPDLNRCLREQGVEDFQISGCILQCDSFPYDTVLVNSYELDI